MLLISDANILIDMDVGGLLEAMFRLEEGFAVPDLLYTEELEAHHPELPALGLQVLPLEEEGVEAAMALLEIYHGPSPNDLFALQLARQENCPLLTGDGALRGAATAEGVELRGTLWLVEALAERKIITVERAAAAYEEMKRNGRWLPWAEVDKQVRRLRKEQG
jgi:predicted nucleic acid-binding protein